MTKPKQVELDQAARDFEKAHREYELAIRDLSSLPPIATHERAALIQRKVEAWNALEAARLRYEDVQQQVARDGGVKF